MTGPTSLASVWQVTLGFPTAEASSKGQEGWARRDLQNAVTGSGHEWDPARLRPMTDQELERAPITPHHGVELRGLYYPLTDGPAPPQELTLENLLIQETA